MEPTTAEVVVGELRNHATHRSGSHVFRTSLEARSEVEKKTALVHCFGLDLVPTAFQPASFDLKNLNILHLTMVYAALIHAD